MICWLDKKQGKLKKKYEEFWLANLGNYDRQPVTFAKFSFQLGWSCRYDNFWVREIPLFVFHFFPEKFDFETCMPLDLRLCSSLTFVDVVVFDK